MLPIQHRKNLKKYRHKKYAKQTNLKRSRDKIQILKKIWQYYFHKKIPKIKSKLKSKLTVMKKNSKV